MLSDPVRDALAPPPLRRRTTADLSSVERSRLNDEMVRTVGALVRQVDALTKLTKAQDQQLREHRAILDAHAGMLLGRRFLARLRWMVTGV